MNHPAKTICIALALLGPIAVFSQSDNNQGQGKAIVTVLPKAGHAVPASVVDQDLSIKVNGKQSKVTKWKPITGPDNSLELVLLIDDSARSSLGTQTEEIAHFIKALPPNAKAAISYMQNGRAVFSRPFSADPAEVLRAFHQPAGSPGSNASPYFCLSDLAKNWPSANLQARREVVMITDGVDNYDRRYDPEDPYVTAAMKDAARAGVIVYSIYWQSRGTGDSSLYENNAGQNLLIEVTQATGGKSYWQGMGNPVSFAPYFDELLRRFQNQYELGFTSRAGNKPEVENFELKLSAPGTEIDSPEQVTVYPAAQTK